MVWLSLKDCSRNRSGWQEAQTIKNNLSSECKEEMEEDIASSLASKKIDEGITRFRSSALNQSRTSMSQVMIEINSD